MEYIRAAGLQARQHGANSFCRQLMTLTLSCLVILTNQLRTANNQETSTGLDKWLLCTNNPSDRFNTQMISSSAKITNLTTHSTQNIVLTSFYPNSTGSVNCEQHSKCSNNYKINACISLRLQ